MNFKKILVSAYTAVSVLSLWVFATPESVLISGQGIGITLNSQGVMVTDTAQIETQNGKAESPAKSGGIKKGDIITKINGEKIGSVKDLSKALSEAEDNAVMVEAQRGESRITLKIKLKKDKTGTPRMGLWTKDAAAGIGTLTFYDPATGDFGALGHGITESTSGALIKINGGEVLTSTIVAVQKGEKGNPGELQGVFGENDKAVGVVKKNTDCGIFGNMELSEGELEKTKEIKIGSRADVRVGKAYILANIEGNATDKFEIEICKIPVFSGDKTKGMVIKITDKRLLDKTGGIVRGMSGCPIVQSGRLVGAITHVFVNDPTMGYGIFIEDMLCAMES